MRLQQISIRGFKSFGKPVVLKMDKPITAIVGPNGSGKSNVVESIRFALGEQSIKSLRGGTSTDLLFKSGNSSRTADSASVTLQFDNSDRVFTLPALEHSGVSFNFDTVTIGREVASDGSQTYSINGTTVRMRDVAELISSVNIGASGHHIISQGEADRLLFAGPRERKVLLEEALGLKLYHYRINDTVRKLDRSADQLREAKLLVKEIEPHIKFLKKQVDMIHQSSELREKLIFQSSEYYAAYTQLLAQWKHTVTKRIQAVVETTQSKSEHIQKLEIELTTSRQNTRVDKHVQLESDIASAQQNLMDLMRSSGKIDMTVETLQHNIDSMRTSIKHHNQSHKKPEHIAYMAYVDFSDTLLAICDISIDSIESAQMVISDIKKHIQKFSLLQDKAVDNTLIEKLTLDIAESELALHNALAQQDQHSRSIDNAKSVVSELQITLHNATEQERNNTAHIHHSERLIDTAKTELAQLNYELQRTEREMEECESRAELLQSEITELSSITGHSFVAGVHQLESIETNAFEIRMRQLSQTKREIDRLVLKLEESGVISPGDTIAEYESTLERQHFLQTEIFDCEKTIDGLKPLLTELQSTVRVKFESGIRDINKQFSDFFVSMFGGGKAEIVVMNITKRRKKSDDTLVEIESETAITDENESETQTEQGIEIAVTIPNKKTGDLSILSGGERSLTSIALLFALSQVNPPPFIVLDETDAALDESNSRKYGQLIQKLSSVSQILVVTHNRETMSHADVLYGVTLGPDSSSQLFSVRLSEAEVYAK